MRRRVGVSRSNASFRKGSATCRVRSWASETPPRDRSNAFPANPAPPNGPESRNLWPVSTRGLTRLITRRDGGCRAPHNPRRGIEQTHLGLCRARLTRRGSIAPRRLCLGRSSRRAIRCRSSLFGQHAERWSRPAVPDDRALDAAPLKRFPSFHDRREKVSVLPVPVTKDRGDRQDCHE